MHEAQGNRVNDFRHPPATVMARSSRAMTVKQRRRAVPPITLAGSDVSLASRRARANSVASARRFIEKNFVHSS